MNEWSLASEYFALILLAVIALFYCDVKPTRGLRRFRVLYWGSLGLSFLSVLLNIAAVHVIENIHSFSVPLAYTLNTIYFLVSWLMITDMVYYLFLRILEFVYDGHCIRRARIIQLALLAFSVLLLAYNIPSGVIFSFAVDGTYRRGPLNAIGYVLPITEVLLLLLCYAHNRRNVGKATEKILFVAAPISLLLMVYQAAYPEQLLNGAICALVNLIIFISYRGGRGNQDTLTGLDNHHCFTLEVMHRTAGKRHYQILLVKLRCLSRINRAYGENGGNVLLFRVGEALQKFAGENRAFRHGDDEFALLFSSAEESECAERLRSVAELMRRRWKLGEYETVLSFSVIEFRYRGEEWSHDDISGYLNDAMHFSEIEDLEVMPFDEALIARRRRREYLLTTMHDALQEGRFQVWYQPVYYHDSNRFESAEALIRMQDEDGNYISPGEFIPVAEETGLVDDLSVVVLEHVCRLLHSGKIAELKAISINLPIRQLVEKDLKARLRSVLDKYDIRPEQIKLEITERDVVDNGYAAAETMHELTALGYRFLLDDFGIGYSNLSRVMSMPLDSVKIDRSLVLLLQKDERHLDFIRNYVVPLFSQLGQNVVAEGIEDAETAELVLSCGINCIQGYYYARPMPEQELELWYAKKSSQNS